MDTLPDDILHTIYPNKHALELKDTLDKINHIKPYFNYSLMDDPDYDTNHICDTHLENDFESVQSHADSGYEINTDASSVTTTHTDDIDDADEYVIDGVLADEAEMLEQFVNASNLTN